MVYDLDMAYKYGTYFLPECNGDELKRLSGDELCVSHDCPCVGEGGGVAVTRWRCFSNIDSKMPAKPNYTNYDKSFTQTMISKQVLIINTI